MIFENDNRVGLAMERLTSQTGFWTRPVTSLNRRVILALSLIIAIFVNHAPTTIANPLTLQSPNDVAPLRRGEGYLLVDLDVDGIAPSFEFIQTRPVSKYIPQKVNLAEACCGLKLLTLPAGYYQITRVNAPYFNLPYRLETSGKQEWQFSIQAGSINYIGKLHIAKERTARTIDTTLSTRIATDIDRIHDELTPLLIDRPLRSATGYRDDFLSELKSTGDKK